MTKMFNIDNFNQQEKFLARDIIDLAREYKDDYSILESLSDFCFDLMRMFDEAGFEDKLAVDWSSLFNDLDQSYSSKKYYSEHIDAIYKKLQ